MTVKIVALLLTAVLSAANLVCAMWEKSTADRYSAEAISFLVLAVLFIGVIAFFVNFGGFVWRMKGTSAGKTLAHVSRAKAGTRTDGATVIQNPLLEPSAGVDGRPGVAATATAVKDVRYDVLLIRSKLK